MTHNNLTARRFGYSLKGKAFAGLSILALTVSLLPAAAVTVTPLSAHAQIFGDDDDQDDPNQKPTDSTVWDAKRLQKLDRNVRKLERAIQRTEKQPNPPILIEPDPEVVALQATVDTMSRKQDEMAATIITLTGQLEDSQHQNQVLQQQMNAMNTRMETLTKRADMADAHLKDVDALLAPPPPPPASTGDAEGDFEQAFNLMTSGQTDDSERAFEAFTTSWPEASQLPEAWFRLGQIRTIKGDMSGAVAAYATSLKGWPKTSWAPEATVKLASALDGTNRPTDACSALAQFDKLYAKTATSDNKTLAKNLKAKDKCPA